MRHVVLGAGPVGTSVAAALLLRSEEVVLVSRTRPPTLSAAVRHFVADARDAEALTRACEGAGVVYQCLNAPYHRWREDFPALQRGAIIAAQAVGARLVSFENVYMYGAPGPEPFTELHRHAPCSDKGRVRAGMVDELRALHARGQLEVAHVRASDLFGPGMRGSALGEDFVGRAVAGKAPRGFGDLEAPHTWTFVPDVGETLAQVGTTADAFGRVWHVPSDAARSQHEIVVELSRILDRPLELLGTPKWLLRLLGLLVPAVGAMVEMAYQFEHAFVVDDVATRGGLGITHTPFAEALESTVRWYGSSRVRRSRH